MLPPVRAALNSSTDFQSLAPAAAARVSLAATKTIVAIDSDRAGPISAGRMDALSLSAQLKLAQSFSIFAETIGKVLDMPRGENEALVDYATRLSEAVKALNPAERMVIERLLNQIVKGVTLRLLAEILNDPAGPDAARLAAYIETASASERDLAAKAVVSSYRQNGSAEQTANGGAPRPAVGNSAAPVSQAPAGTAGAAPTNTGTAVVPSAAPSQGSPTEAVAQTVQPESEQEVSSIRPDGQKPAQGAKADAAPAGQDDIPERPAKASAQAATAAKDAAAVRLQPAQMAAVQAGDAEASANAAAASGTAAAGEDGETAPARGLRGEVSAGAPRSDDTRAKSPRLVGPGMHAPSVDGRAGLSNARLMLAELSAWMAGVLSGAETAEADAATTKPSAPTAAPAPAGEDVPQNEILAQEAATKQAAGSARGAGAADIAVAAKPGEAPPTESAAGSQADGAEPLDRQMAALAAGWTQTTREGVPWPYVAYPPAEQEPEREERKARAIAEIGDEEDEAPAQDHGFHQERQDDDAQDEAKEGAEDAEDVRPDEDEGRPNDLYWRMAGWA